MALDKPYRDIPGTTVFDADQARLGSALNEFCMSLMNPQNRDRFLRDERTYLQTWGLTAGQQEAVLSRDFNRMLALGGNIYMLAKIGATDGQSYLQIVASMVPETEDEYREIMLAGGRPPDGNRYLAEWDRRR